MLCARRCRRDTKRIERVIRIKFFSAILYGPPGTGKTTLLEALALTSKVPLVMLSPSDLIALGREQLEGQAKAVFDALSMLSQTVILLDEFEPVLYRRDPDVKEKRTKEDSATILRFLLTGMLPKLVTLHDAAEQQSLVYCLATNHLEQIDGAAKRGGRFDVHQPIYNPDPISRAGAFLFRLQPIANKFLTDARNQYVFASIVAATANENAGELARKFSQAKLKAYSRGESADDRWYSNRKK